MERPQVCCCCARLIYQSRFLLHCYGSDADPAPTPPASARALSPPSLQSTQRIFIIVITTIDTMHIRYHHHQRTIATSTDIEQRPHSSTTNYIGQRHLDSANDDSSFLDVRISALDSVLFVPDLINFSRIAYCSQLATTALGLVYILSVELDRIWQTTFLY